MPAPAAASSQAPNTTEVVVFESGGHRVVGRLHRNARSGASGPAVVVVGPMTSVKEQVTGTYARALASLGISALAFDHRHFGESGGEPRQYERWDRKVEDIVAALETLATLPEIDAARIGLVGVCLGAGYAAHAATRSGLVRAVGAVAGYYRNPTELRAKDPTSFDGKVAQGIAARLQYEKTGITLTIPAASLTGDAAMTSADTVDYYTRRCAVSNYRNEFAVMSREWFLPFDVQAAADALRVPVRMVHSEQALSPDWARLFHSRLRNGELIWTSSKGQTDFYDDSPLVERAAALLVEHFQTYLS